ncbi:hypothetical protein DVA86_11870 [Streptomyces armeniacus]|uniref:Uncharacterized protein n=1 Tax=Streptomyces armeniacus TaxID=83291 RepID=A0A345XNN1_9ACTN|nr:hypothetical protein [Streptomyces armeniacus]AXK33247.1 hypothetical protein DVA86_11870 [Streptomyces armeniacus]
MLALRLVRGARPLTLLRRLLVACATAGVGFLLLSALSYGVAHPHYSGDALVRLLWCLVPLAAATQLAAAVARTETGPREPSALDAAGVGPARLPLLAAVSAAVTGALGSALALLVFLQLRGGFSGLPFDGAAADVLDGHRPLPSAAVLTLLCVAPAAAAVASALAVRRGARTARTGRPVRTAAPSGLPWGAALTATGITSVTLARHGSPVKGDESGLLPLPGTLDGSPPAVIGGWLLAALGLVLAGPGLTHLCGRLISLGRPGALRLLSGRVLQEEAVRVGRPLGVLCAVASGALAAAELYGTAPAGGARVFGPLTALGAALVMCCATASALTAATECRADRAPVTATLLRLGAPRRLLRGAAALRGAVLVAVLAPVTWGVGVLAALPLNQVVG